MEIWRVPWILPGVAFTFFFLSSVSKAECENVAKAHSILSVSYTLTHEQPDSGAFVERDERHETQRPAPEMLRRLPEPYSYVLASVGIASLLAMGGVYRVRKPPMRPTRGSVRHRGTGPRWPRR